MIYAGFPSFFGLGLENCRGSSFWLLLQVQRHLRGAHGGGPQSFPAFREAAGSSIQVIMCRFGLDRRLSAFLYLAAQNRWINEGGGVAYKCNMYICIYRCIYIHMYVCACKHAYVYVCVCIMYLYTCAAYICLCIRTYIHSYIPTYLPTYLLYMRAYLRTTCGSNTHLLICKHRYMYPRTHICTCYTYGHTHVYIYIHMHMYVYIDIYSWSDLPHLVLIDTTS